MGFIKSVLKYEENLQNDRRNIFILKSRFLSIVKDDLEEMMEYKKGSTQYKSETLKHKEQLVSGLRLSFVALHLIMQSLSLMNFRT